MQMLSPAAVEELTRSVDGNVALPGDDRVEELTRGFNVAHSHQSAMVFEAATTDDIRTAVEFANAHRMPVAVQATGHGQFLDTRGAVVVLTRRLDEVRVDPDRRTATIGPGVRWRQVLDAAAPYGLAPLSGSASSVGAVGYLLGGGVGPLARKYGFGADSIISLKLITADGVEQQVDKNRHPDMFWAVRGGKSNFGIVTELTFKLYPVAEVFAASVYFDVASIEPVLRRFAKWSEMAPPEITSSVAILRLPDAEFVPPPLRGRTVAHLRWVDCTTDSEESAIAQFAWVRSAGTVVLETCGRRRPADLDFVHDDPIDPCPIWERTAQVSRLSDSFITDFLAHAGPEADFPLAMVEIRQLGGALAQEPEAPNAVAGRYGQFTMLLLGICEPEMLPSVSSSGCQMLEDLRPHLTGYSLMNWLGCATSAEDVCAAWDAHTLSRLLKIKARLDPHNMFRFGHPITAE